MPALSGENRCLAKEIRLERAVPPLPLPDRLLPWPGRMLIFRGIIDAAGRIGVSNGRAGR